MRFRFEQGEEAQRAQDRRLRSRLGQPEAIEDWLTDGVGAPPPEDDSELSPPDADSGQSSEPCESDTFDDVLPGLRAAVVARGMGLMGVWGEPCPMRARLGSLEEMRAGDFAAMALRLSGTARGSSFAYLAEDAGSPSRSAQSRSRSEDSGSDCSDSQHGRTAGATPVAATRSRSRTRSIRSRSAHCCTSSNESERRRTAPPTPTAAASNGSGQRVELANAVSVNSSDSEPEGGHRAASEGHRREPSDSFSPQFGYDEFSGPSWK